MSIEFGKINVYGDAHKKIIFLNLILLIMNIINIFFNVFRYIFNGIISWIRIYILFFSNIWVIVSLMIFVNTIKHYWVNKIEEVVRVD